MQGAGLRAKIRDQISSERIESKNRKAYNEKLKSHLEALKEEGLHKGRTPWTVSGKLRKLNAISEARAEGNRIVQKPGLFFGKAKFERNLSNVTKIAIGDEKSRSIMREDAQKHGPVTNTLVRKEDGAIEFGFKDGTKKVWHVDRTPGIKAGRYTREY